LTSGPFPSGLPAPPPTASCRLPSVQLALGILLFGRLMVINVLVNWFHLGPLAAYLVALAAMTPVGHLPGSRLIWRPTRG
jgi:hypothetical protein